MLRQSHDVGKRAVTPFPWPGRSGGKGWGELAVYLDTRDPRQWVLRQWVCTEDGAGRRGSGTFTFRSFEAQEREDETKELVRDYIEIIRCDCVMVAKGTNSEYIES